MKKKSRQLIDEIGQEQLPAGYMAFPEKIQQHCIGGHTRKKCCRKGCAAVIAKMTESKQGAGQYRHGFNPAGGLDQLSNEQPQSNEQQ